MQQIVDTLVRCIEWAVSGRSEYHLTLSEFEDAAIIDNGVQAKRALGEVRRDLREQFAIDLARPVIIQLGQPTTLDWKTAGTPGYNHVGNYTPRWFGDKITHGITIVPGLKRTKFKAVLGHELGHAFQSERALQFSSSGLKEGMSRWIEYHLLLRYGMEEEAAKLLKLQRYLLGKAMVDILDYETKHGRAATMAWLCAGVTPGNT